MLRGLYTPNFTAFKANGEVDFAATKEHGAWLYAQGVTGLVPFGTFGEGSSLSLKERIRITRELADVQGSSELIPTIISNSYGEILEYIDAVKDLPLSAFMVIPPSYFRPLPDAGLIDFYKRLVDFSPHNIIAYNIPEAALTISPEVLAAIPVWGVKDSSGSMDSVNAFLGTGKKLLVGSDALLAKAISVGANGGICGISNLFPKQMLTAHSLAVTGDFEKAQSIIDSIMGPIGQILGPNPGMSKAIGTLKTYGKLRGPADLGFMRPPLPVFPQLDANDKIFSAAVQYLESLI